MCILFTRVFCLFLLIYLGASSTLQIINDLIMVSVSTYLGNRILFILSTCVCMCFIYACFFLFCFCFLDIFVYFE